MLPLARHLVAALVVVGACLSLSAAASAQGLLIPTDQRLQPLALKHHRVDIEVKDGTAVTTLEQVYVNGTDRPLEATYLFPVPDEAVVIDFRLMVNGVMKKGEVLERDKAEQIYTEIVRSMRDPGIVDWMDKTLFRARIFPVPARGEQKITITYTQILPFLDGSYKLSYPLRTPAAAVKTLEDFTLTATIEHQTPIKTVYSPSHKIAVGRRGDHSATVGFEGEQVSLDKDFVLYFGVSKKDVGMTLLTYRPDDEPGFFMLMAAPKAVFDTDEIQGKAITFVLDTSGSMTGEKMEHAKKALVWCLEHLGHDDRFDVIRFSSDVEAFKGGLVSASSDNVAAARRFVEDFDAAGGTAIDDALAKALSARAGDDNHLVLFITDGRPTVGETGEKAILDRIAAANGGKRARIFALGIGDDINTHLLDRLANDNGGTSAYVKPGEDMDTHIAALYNQIAYPVLTDVGLDISNVRTYAALPGDLPDIFRGGQLILVGRYRGDGDALVRMTGRMGKEARQFDFEGTFARRQTDNAFIAGLWAHRQVGFLLDQIRLTGETRELREEVVQLAKKYGIVTPYTSYLVVEDGAMPQVGGPRPIEPPRPMPRPNRVRTGGAATRPDDDPAPPAASPEEAERDMMDFATGGASRGFKADDRDEATKSGRDAVTAAKTVRRLKDKEQAGSETARVRHVSGRVLLWRGDGWVEDGVGAGLTRVAVVPFSDGWIALVRALPSLRDALSLGERVTVKVGGYAIVITPDGARTVDAATIAKLKAAAK